MAKETSSSVSYQSRSFFDHLLILFFTWGLGYIFYGCRKKIVTKNYQWSRRRYFSPFFLPGKFAGKNYCHLVPVIPADRSGMHDSYSLRSCRSYPTKVGPDRTKTAFLDDRDDVYGQLKDLAWSGQALSSSSEIPLDHWYCRDYCNISQCWCGGHYS